jgi:hypothetical protein
MSTTQFGDDRRSREVLLFMPRERAHALRRRMLTGARFRHMNVSRLYRVGTGWGLTLGVEQRGAASRRHTERRTRTA